MEEKREAVGSLNTMTLLPLANTESAVRQENSADMMQRRPERRRHTKLDPWLSHPSFSMMSCMTVLSARRAHAMMMHARPNALNDGSNCGACAARSAA